MYESEWSKVHRLLHIIFNWFPFFKIHYHFDQTLPLDQEARTVCFVYHQAASNNP